MVLRKTSTHFVITCFFSVLLILSVSSTSIGTTKPILFGNQKFDVPSSQMNHIIDQLYLDPYVWDTLGFSGDSNASIAIIGSGIDWTHPKFGLDSYGDKDFTKKIIGWKDYVNISNLEPIDPNGLSTFTAASAYGSNDTESKVSIDSENRTSITLGGKYLQTNLFPKNPGPGWFDIKLGSFYIDQEYANLTLNGTYQEFSSLFIKNASFQIRRENIVLNKTDEDIYGNYKQITYTTDTQPAIYDLYFHYYLDFSKPANFTINVMLNTPLENKNDYSGVAPDTKIVALRVLDSYLNGNVSSIISALNWTKNNRDDYHIVAVQIDLGNYIWDMTTTDVSNIMEEVIESGIMIILPSGDESVIMDGLNPLVRNELPIVVGSVSDIGKLTYYTSLGTEFSSTHKKIDIVAPGGSYLAGHRTIIAADTNANDVLGDLTDQHINDSTSFIGSSVSAAFVAASYNLLIEALGGYSAWQSIRTKNMTLTLKSRLLMTATELNQAREDNPYSSLIDESSSRFSPELNRGEKDMKEGFGMLNIPAALESILFELNVDDHISSDLVSITSNSSGLHSVARKIQLIKNEYYNFSLTFANTTDLDLYIYQNVSNIYGDPILIQDSITTGTSNESIVFGLKQDTGTYIAVIKAISGNLTTFTLNVTHLSNNYSPTLTNHTVGGIQGFNDTLDIFEFIINYTDLDNLPPITLDLNVSGFLNLIPFSKVISDVNYTDGCLYSAQFHFYEIGMYEYHILAWDGISLVRSPEVSNYSIEVAPIYNAIYENYTWNFSTMEYWELNGYWNNITQLNSIDSRGAVGGEWSALYFGDPNSVSDGKYSYESVPELSVSTAYSPQFWLNKSSNPLLQLGTRISINQGDYFLINARSNRTGSWNFLDSFTYLENEWSLLEYNLSDYLGTYVQIQFLAYTNIGNDYELNKGILISEFNILHQYPENLHPIVIFNETITPQSGSLYQNYRFSTIIGDQDGIIPEIVYLEIDHVNYTMFNIYGDFDSSYVVYNGTLQSGGICYAYDIYLASVSNSSYRFHVKSNGDFISTGFFEGPRITQQINSTFPFYGVLKNMNVYGNPRPHPQTIWVSSSNSFHYVSQDSVWYAGEDYYSGYGVNWHVYLVTSLIHVPRSSEETDRVYLWFEHQLFLDTLNPTLFGEDYARIQISPDYGVHWYELEVYDENINGYQDQKIDLWNYKGKDVLIRFEFHSDDISFLPTFQTGWYIRNIKVNVDESIDKEPPTILFTNILPNMIVNETFTLEITIIDPSGIDDGLVTLYINTVSIDDAVCENGVIIYDLDTTKFRNGNTTISVLAFDQVGNQIIASTYVTIRNEASPFIWIYIIAGITVALIAGLLVLYFQVFKPARRKREIAQEMLSEEDKQKLLEEQKARELEEMRIREEAELASPESEALKPFIYKCSRCSKQFQNKEYIWSMECPDCKTDTLSLLYQCKLCGKYYHYDVPGEYYCSDCNVKLLK